MLIARSDVVGGTNVIMRNLCAGLEGYGITTTAIVGGSGPYLLDLEAHGVRYMTIPGLSSGLSPSHDLNALAQLRRLLRKVKPDLLACHDPKAGVVGRIVGRQLGIPVVYTAHGWPFGEGVPRRQAGVREFVERTTARLLPSAVLSVCEHDRMVAIKHSIGAASTQLMVRNGIPDVDPAFRAEPAVDPPHIVSIARFIPQKDQATLIEALSRLTDREWTAELVGDGEELGACMALAVRLGIGDRVSFTGAVTRPQDYLAGAQIFALTSNWEGLPLTLLEAMRAGLPAVASDVGGVSEALDHGETGILVPRGSVAEVAAALSRLIDEPSLRVEMGIRARKQYESDFTHDRMLADVAKIYRLLVEQTSQ